MATDNLLTSWGEHDAAVERMIPLARHSIAIFDHDLAAFRLEKPALHQALLHFLRVTPGATLRIAVQNADPLRRNSPRLLELLRLFAHSFHLMEIPPHLANLSDSMLLIDDNNALIRFHRDHARSKAIIADAEGCQPYRKRFEDIWNEGGTPVSATTVGL